jgi:hypothetical protein
MTTVLKKTNYAWIVLGILAVILLFGWYFAQNTMESYNRNRPFWSIRYDFSNPDIIGIEIRKAGKVEANLKIEEQYHLTGIISVDFRSNRMSTLPFGKIEFIDVNLLPGKIIVTFGDYRITMWPDELEIEGKSQNTIEETKGSGKGEGKAKGQEAKGSGMAY